jgi:hypothetical protein
MDDIFDILQHEYEAPDGGWKKPCNFSDHQWGIEIEEGRVRLICLDPCDLNKDYDQYDPGGPLPTCAVWWEAEDLVTQAPIPVRLNFVDDSSPAGPWGEAEYGFYIEVGPR